MRSVRQFCREADYPVSLFLTYSFDPLFFERIPWAELRAGGSRRILVAADAGQVADAMRRCMGQTVYLGRRYLLAETVLANTFHPKLIARLSAQGGRVWVGSGNLTYTGWGGNHELGTTWSIGPGEPDSGAWLDELLAAVSSMVRSTSFADQLHAIRAEVPWLTRRPASTVEPPVLFGMPGRPLARQLAERWRGRRFDELKLCTGSTDKDGEFLKWAHRQFQIKRATICLTPAHASFDVAQLARLPFDVRIVEAAREKVMHAKFYWFSGPDGPAAVVGSANCSVAAWLGANVELIVPYDQPDEVQFAPALEVFRDAGTPPEQALADVGASSETEEEGASPQYRLVSLRLTAGKIIEAVLDPQPDADAQVTLFLGDRPHDAAIRLTARLRMFAGRLPPDFATASATAYGVAEVLARGVTHRTDPRWIDNDVLLERSSTARPLDRELQDLSHPGLFNADRHRILETIRRVSAQILSTTAPANLPSSLSRKSNTDAQDKPQRTNAPAALDPAAMVRSLQEITRERHERFGGKSFPYAGTLHGVMAMLFAGEEDPNDMDLGRETWGATEPDKNSDQDDSNGPPTRPAGPPPQEPTATETLHSFQQQLRSFLDELAKPAFAESCLPTRMVEALAYPLFLCLSGADAGWLPPSELPAVATRVTGIMLYRPYGPGKPRGLLYMVRQRHDEAGRLDEFESAAGNGTLWTVLLAALAPRPDAPLPILLPQAAALIAVIRCQDLLARTDPTHLSSLVRSVRVRA
jgi:hypothetical protein